MDIRNYKNIVPYGFLVFLIIAGVFSIFSNNEVINANINGLAIPVFLLSVSILLSKSNKYVREKVFGKIEQLDRTIKQDHAEDYSMEKLENLEEYNMLCKHFMYVDRCTKWISIIAIISFSICLLSMIGIISIPISSGYINLFSLALVFFDFFIWEDMIQKKVDSSINKICEEAKEKAHHCIESDDDINTH